MASKRARQINAYYAQLGEGLLEYVGPLVETQVQEKPLSIALREISEGLLTAEERARRPDPAAARGAVSGSGSVPGAAPRVFSASRGGIAAYKSCELLRLLTESGHGVTVVPTADALRFVGAATWAALSGKPGRAESGTTCTRCRTCGSARAPTWSSSRPATADLLARAAPAGRRPAHRDPAHRPLPGRVRARDAHRDVGAPGDAGQRRHAARPGRVVLDPAAGRLTGADSGPGRLPEPAAIFASAAARARPRRRRPRPTSPGGASSSPRAAPGRTSTRSGSSATGPPAGRATRWPRAAAARGAEVTLVAANVALPDPAGVKVVRVDHAPELRDAVLAPQPRRRRRGDGRGRRRLPAGRQRRRARSRRRRRTPEPLRLMENPDILAELSAQPAAARPGHRRLRRRDRGRASVLENGRAKLARKGCDLLVVNEVGGGAGLRHRGQRGGDPRRRRLRDRRCRAGPRSLWPT